MTTLAEVKIEKTAYEGWKNCYRVTNGEVELIVTGDIGPRIIRCAFVGGRNLFKEYREQLGKSGEKDYQLRGGHRLWVAPEDLKTSWALDNGPIDIQVSGGVLSAVQPVDSAGIQKTIIVKMAPGGGKIEVVHRATNRGKSVMEFSPWTLTMMTPGGVAITGFPPRGTHPEVLLPTNPLVMWAYTNLADPRWGYFEKYLTLRQDPKAKTPQKIGLFNPNTWGAYVLGSEMYLKQSKAEPGKPYPDFGCSFETFTNADMLEVESLGPLQKVRPGATVEHVEYWNLVRGIQIGKWDEATLDRVLKPLLTH